MVGSERSNPKKENGEMKMEIPTEEIIKRLGFYKTTPVALDAIEVIKAQAREIRELQATICRLKDEYRISSDLRQLEARNG